MSLPRMVELARTLAERVLRSGDWAIDATVGNGHDTLWLARHVGPTGHVLGLDLQLDALRKARNRLREAGLADRVLLIRAGHERLDALLPDLGPTTRPKVVLFNLGFLPGGDRSIATRPESTIAALEASRRRIGPGGLVLAVSYPGHEPGRSESELLLRWARARADAGDTILRCETLGTRSPAPWLLALGPPRTPRTEPPPATER